jgi:hypothetical protein
VTSDSQFAAVADTDDGVIGRTGTAVDRVDSAAVSSGEDRGHCQARR